MERRQGEGISLRGTLLENGLRLHEGVCIVL